MNAIRILLADDDAGYRFPIKNLFEDHQYTVYEAQDVNQVMDYAKNADVWIIDVRLPTGAMEGILAVRDLVVKRGTKPAYKVLFISASPESTAADKLAQLKGRVEFEYIEKPFELELLLNKVEGFTKVTKGASS